MEYAHVAATATTCVPNSDGFPNSRPSLPAGLISFCANNPVSRAPSVPPIPWTPKTSSESSTPVLVRRETAAKHTQPPASPMTIDDSGPT
jgi:hypothetical protein